MVSYKLDDYPQILNTRHIVHHDGAPVLFEHQRDLYVYFGGFRDYPWDPIKMFAESSGVYGFFLKRGTTFSHPTHIIENSIIMDPSNRRYPLQILRPLAFENGSEFDHLHHIVFVFKWKNQIYALTQVEDSFNNGEWNYIKYPVNTPVYGLGAMIKAEDNNPLKFERLYTTYQEGMLVSEQVWNTYVPQGGTPILMHWQTKEQIMSDSIILDGEVRTAKQPPGNIRGVAVSSGVIIGDYLYIFYTRLPDLRNHFYRTKYKEWYGYSPYPTVISKPDPDDPDLVKKLLTSYLCGSMCVARMNLNDLSHPDYKNRGVRVYKYFNGSFSQPGIGGYDTAILPNPGSYAHVIFNTYLNRFVMASQYDQDGIQTLQLFVSKIEGKCESALTSWESLGECRMVRPYARYPRLVNADGESDQYMDKSGWLYYVIKVPGIKGEEKPRLARRTIEFNK